MSVPIPVRGNVRQIDRAFLLLSLIVSISLVLKLTVWRFVADTDPARFLRQPDSQSYIDSARALWQIGRFAVSPDQPDQPATFRTPGYPAYLAVLYGFSGRDDVTIVVLSQILLSVGTIILVFWLSTRLWNSTVAVIAASLLLFDLPSFTSSLVVMSETLFTLSLTCVIVVIAYLLQPHTRRKGLGAVVAGTLLGLATLIRPVSYYLVIVVGLSIGWLGNRERWPNKTVMSCVVLILVPYLLLVGGWHMRNYLLTGDSAFSQVFATSMLFYRAAGVIALRDGISLEEAQARLRPTVVVRHGHVDLHAMMAQGLAIIWGHPLLALRTQITGVLTMLLGFGDGVFTRMLYTMPDGRSPSLDLFQLPLRQHLERWLWSKPLPFLAFLLSAAQLVVLYGGIGLWWGGTLWAKQRVASIHLLLWGIIVYFVAVTAGPEANSRFRVPLMPVLVMYAAAGLSWLETLRRGGWQSNSRL